MAVFLPVAFPVLPDRYINSLVSQSPFPSRSLPFCPHPRSFPSPPYCCGETRGTTEDAACSFFGRAINWVLIGLISFDARWAIAQLPGPHPSDRACRLCGAVGADGILYRRTQDFSQRRSRLFHQYYSSTEGLRLNYTNDIMRRKQNC